MQAAERAYGGAPAIAPAHAAPVASGGRPSFALDVVGPSSNPDKVARCNQVVQRTATINPSASLRATLTLGPGNNRLQIAGRRGSLYDQAKPGWGMEQLCADIVQQVAMLGTSGSSGSSAHAEPQPAPKAAAAPPPAPPAKTTKHALVIGPIPASADLAPGVKTNADNAIRAWSSADFLGARNFFREAGQAGNDPQFLYDQAVCEQRLNQTADALRHVQEFLKAAPDSPYKPYAVQLKGELQGN